MVLDCPCCAFICERFSMLYMFLGGAAHTWANLPAAHTGDHMRCFMDLYPVVVAAFVHACWRVRGTIVGCRKLYDLSSRHGSSTGGSC